MGFPLSPLFTGSGQFVLISLADFVINLNLIARLFRVNTVNLAQAIRSVLTCGDYFGDKIELLI